jgi:DNA-directed RNA polymerase subunit RPC12/RpoP
MTESGIKCSYCGGIMVWDKENKLWICINCGRIGD